MTSFPSTEELKGTVRGTIFYLLFYALALLPFQTLSKHYLYAKKKKEAEESFLQGGSAPRVSFREVKYYNSRDVLALTSDRTVGNFQEQALLFLPLLWMHALFVDPSRSLAVCCVYILTRALYPILFPFGLIVLASTVPGYLVLMYLFAGIVSKLDGE